MANKTRLITDNINKIVGKGMAYVPYPPTLPIETPGDSAAGNKDGGIAPPDTREMTAP